ncbi:MAG: TnsD family Tn7-like transposition protein [Motiliproteus sp.]
MRNKEYQVSHLTFFPKLLPDETAYSVINRFHQRSGLPSSRSTLNLLFGDHNFQLSSDVLSVIPQLCQACHSSIQEFISEHTVIPFYRPFTTPKKYQRLSEVLATGDGSRAIKELSLSANRMISEPYFKSCYSCFREDKEIHGLGYWHCGHQLPGISCCAKHAEELHEYKKGRRKLVAPTGSEKPKLIEKTSPAYRYTTLVSEYFYNSAFHLDHEKLYQTYYQQLEIKGFITKFGHIRQRHLKLALYSYWQGTFRNRLFKQINPMNQAHHYPECLFYFKKSNHHPIKHLLLIGFLFGSWSEFISQYENSYLKKTSRYKETYIYSDPLESKKNLARKLLHTGISLIAIAKKVRLSVTTLRCLAEQEGVEIAVRPKSLYRPVRRAIWRKLMIGKSIKSIAKKFGVSVGSIEQILTSHRYLIPLRRRIRHFKSRQKHRNFLESMIKENPSIRRVDVQKYSKGAYAWLYRHDREWLYKTLPPAIPRPRRFSRQ